MGLTYRGSLTSSLSITEVDNNFRHFTGSHSVTGSVTAADSFIAPILQISESATLYTSSDATNFRLAVSGSKLYFHSGSAWHQVSLV